MIKWISLIDFGIQWVLWGLASCLKYNKFYDSAGIQNKKNFIHGTLDLYSV